MKNLKPFIVFLFCIVLSSCQKQGVLHEDKNLTQIFSKSEIAEIEKMVAFVDDMVLKSTNNTSIDSAYHQFLDKVYRLLQDSSQHFVPFAEEEKYRFLESLDSTVFNDFWRMSDQVKTLKYKDSLYHNLENFKSLELKSIGRYVDYLGSIGNGDEYFKELKELIDVAGDLGPTAYVGFLMNHRKFDFNIPKNHLWVTVFILRMEEGIDIKMERYLKSKS